MDTIKLKHLPDGTYATDPFITAEEWLFVLKEAEKKGNSKQLNALLRFFRMRSHKGTCKAVAKVNNTDFESERSLITNFGMFAQKALGSKFRVESADSEDDTFWPIPMLGKDLGKKGFEWTVRPELVDAIRQYLLDKLMHEYRERILEGGLDNKYSKELYKWKLLSACKGKSDLEVIKSMIEMNLISWRAAASLRKILEAEPEETVKVFSIMKDPDRSFADKFKEYKAETRKLAVGSITNSIDNDRTAALFLACLDPVNNSLYKFEIHKNLCDYLGYSVKGGADSYQQYVELVQPIIEWEKADAELTAKLHSETDPYFWSELLNAQDVLWQMRDYMNSSHPVNWLQKVYDQAITAKAEVFDYWYPIYEDSVNKYLGMFEEGNTAVDVSDKTRDDFLREAENGISSNKQGRYSDVEYEKILGQWPDIYETLKKSVLAGEIDKDDYKQLFHRLVPYQNRIKYAAYHRLWAGLFPDYLTTIISDDHFYSLYKSIREKDDSLPAKKGDWLEDNLTLMSYFQERVTFEKPWHRAVFGWYLYDVFFKNNNNDNNDNNSDMDKYIEILKANKNVIFNGAPGTGKTYLAKNIAAKMICNKPYSEDLEKDSVFSSHCRFVQFHPSYDYTDFVEGLRPMKDVGENVTFKRKDGVFKEFCKKAITDTMVNGVDNFDEAWDRLVEALNEKGEIEIQLLSGSKTMFVELNMNGDGLANRTYEDPVSNDVEKREWVRGRSKFFSKGQLYNIYRGLPGIPSGGHDHYRKAIVEEMKRSYSLKPYKTGITPEDESSTPYVFIIDEINRGEISKIFGELFFSIDPGYRGTRGLVLTQYQNLVEPTDVFYQGFYVPKNVFIIGTMNDIDRSVESMDFAMRRRFAFEEIFADQNVPMLDGIPEKDVLIERMKGLNEIIAKEPELGISYQVGGAYFAKTKDCRASDNSIDWQVFWNRYLRGLLNEYTRGLQNKPKLIAAMEKAIVNPGTKKDDGSAE